MKRRWSESSLKQEGFIGWAPLRSVDAVRAAPRMPGVYVVSVDVTEPIVWQPNCGGWFKDRDPAISLERLNLNWVNGAEIGYIGKANDLKRRLVEFAKFGLGRRIGHWGGRILWHLPQPDQLRVAWKVVDHGIDPALEERKMIKDFAMAYGKPPFANHPDRDGRLT